MPVLNKNILFVWLGTVVLAWVLMHSIHTGPTLYCLFLVINWPFLLFIKYESGWAFILASLIQLAYVLAIRGGVVFIRNRAKNAKENL